MTASLLPIAGTSDGGRIRTLSAPFAEDPDSAAVRAVLMSWCRANGLDPERMLERHNIEIHPRDDDELARDRYVIYWREYIPPPAGATGSAREGHTEVRKTPLLVEPEGLLADELTCGHVHLADSPVDGVATLPFTCREHIDPRTGRHPSRHLGGRAETPTGQHAGGTGYVMSWPNEHPGDLAFRDGMPYAGDLDPHRAHALILVRLSEIADRRPRVNRRLALLAIGVHVRGLREIALRHEPHDTRNAGTVCNHDFVTGAGLTPWPCVEVRDALAGIIAFAPAVDR